MQPKFAAVNTLDDLRAYSVGSYTTCESAVDSERGWMKTVGAAAPTIAVAVPAAQPGSGAVVMSQPTVPSTRTARRRFMAPPGTHRRVPGFFCVTHCAGIASYPHIAAGKD
jgi:hypothetical protein